MSSKELPSKEQAKAQAEKGKDVVVSKLENDGVYDYPPTIPSHPANNNTQPTNPIAAKTPPA
jgi:hypothetical protein